jgi:hypothetical protein
MELPSDIAYLEIESTRARRPSERARAAAFMHRRDRGETFRCHVAGDPGGCGRGSVPTDSVSKSPVSTLTA